MVKQVKGQATLDAANARKAEEANSRALATMTPESGFEHPKTLKQLEGIVERAIDRGNAEWRKAAEALTTIRDAKLWKGVLDPTTGKPYKNFVAYAEARFGIKKTYAYDLIKAGATDAETEGAAREAAKAERAAKPLDRKSALAKLAHAWTAWEDRSGGLRDRIPEEDITWFEQFDRMTKDMHAIYSAFVEAVTPVEVEAVEVSADAENQPSE